ncbi:hypothetical protein Syun_006262 [Stephania yunnanensis]|uniref:Replication protein A OB domain-containing protein n=1 Tax=Stephania yunnanensis TaxID=152371 RepID=A0AAP0KWC7_9MAGN
MSEEYHVRCIKGADDSAGEESSRPTLHLQHLNIHVQLFVFNSDHLFIFNISIFAPNSSSSTVTSNSSTFTPSWTTLIPHLAWTSIDYSSFAAAGALPQTHSYNFMLFNGAFHFSETMMHATVRKNQISKYKHILQEGCIFSMKHLKVTAAANQYQPIKNGFRIFFMAITAIHRLQNDSVVIPKYGFQFISSEAIYARVNDNTTLTDVIGCLSGVGNITHVGAERKIPKREIEVLGDEITTMKVTLWGTLAETFDFNPYTGDAGPFIVIFTSTTIKKYQGELYFSSTSATRIYINIEVPHVKSLADRFSMFAPKTKQIESKEVIHISDEEDMIKNRKRIIDILQMEWVDDQQVHDDAKHCDVEQVNDDGKEFHVVQDTFTATANDTVSSKRHIHACERNPSHDSMCHQLLTTAIRLKYQLIVDEIKESQAHLALWFGSVLSYILLNVAGLFPGQDDYLFGISTRF